MTGDAVAMSDDAAEPAGAPFTIVPTLDGYKALEARLRTLERGAEAIAAPAPTIIPDQGAAERLDRHRRELEQLKSWCNDMTRYLTAILPAGIQPPPKPEDYL
jgi:hypothetical protein